MSSSPCHLVIDSNRIFRLVDGTLTIIDTEADGNCLFRSISDQLYHDFGGQHVEVRDEVCNYIEGHKEDFSVFLVLDDEDAAVNEEDAANFETYVFQMRQDGDWGGHLELVAAARMYRCVKEIAHDSLCLMFYQRFAYIASLSRNITVYSSSLDAHTIEHGSDKISAGPDLLLSYHDNDHYNSVRRSSGSKPPPPIKTYVASRFSPMQEGDLTNKDDGADKTLEESTTTKSAAGIGTIREVGMVEKPCVGPAKKISLCPCGSGLRYKKCCAAKEKRLSSRVAKLRHQVTVRNDSNIGSNEPSVDGKFRVLRI